MNLDRLIRKKERAIIENNPIQLAVACNSLGDWYHENQQYENALECYKEEAKAYEKLGKRLEKSRAHRMIGEICMLLEQFEDALKHELIYLSTAVELNNKIEEQRAYATIGRVYLTKAQSQSNALQKTDDLAKSIKCAEKYFLKSLLICKGGLSDLPKHEVLDMTARLYLNLGITYECKEEFHEAIKYFEKAMSICRHNDFWELLHKCYLDAGLLYFNKLDDQTKALQLFNLAINIAERLTTDRTVRICQTLLAKSDVLIKMADFQGAKQILHKAYKLKTPDESDAESIETNLKIVAAMCKAEDALITTNSDDSIVRKKLYEKLGDGACKLRNFSAAIGYYKKMLEAAEKNGDSGAQLIPVYVSLYQTYRDMSEYNLALEFMQKEYELCKDVPSEKLSTLMGIADTQSLAGKDFWAIDAIYEEAKEVAQTMGNKKKEKLVLMKQLALREKYEMTTLANIMREELNSSSFNVLDCADEDSNDGHEAESSEEVNTPDVGDDICLDELSDSADENEEEQNRTATVSNQTRTLRKRGCFTVKKNEKGESQLHRACINGNLALARRLIDQGHPVNCRDNAGWLPIHEAANHGLTDIVELLLDNGATINDKGGTGCEGFTPLHDACGNGVLSVVELLLNRGANATLKNDHGDTALQTLVKWRTDRILNAQEQSFYDTIYQRMYKQLEKAGVSACIDHSVSQNELKVRTLTRKQSRNRIISDSASSEDDHNDENRLPNTEVPETIDSIIHEELPPVDSPEPEVPSSGCMDYQKVMSDLRKRNFQSDINAISKTFKPVEKTVRKSAMLAPEEVSDDDWLENDLEPSAKRRRYLNERTFSADSNKSSNRGKKDKLKLSGSSLNDSMVVSSTNNIILSDNSDEENAFNVLMQTNQNHLNGRRKKRRTSSSSRLSGESSSMMQSSLIKSGFHRHRAHSPDLILPSSVSSTVISPHKIIISPHKISIVPTPVQSHSVKVQVSDLYLNIPVSLSNANDLTIEWLADEAAKRYYGLKGVQPVLRLTTKDGAIFQNSDPISLAFAENSAIASTVLEWIMPPLASRYMETCAQTKTNADPFIKAQIELIASTQSLSIKDQILSPKHSRPLFKALHFQTNITKIDFTNSFIEDEGLKHFVQALPTMKQITSINLTGNLITMTGVRYFSNIFDGSPDCLPELNTLILDNNPLQNQSLAPLEKICMNLAQLQTLHLSSTELTDLQNCDLRFANLTDCDLSFNSFTPTGLLKSIDKLNSCKLEKLTLSFCGTLLNRQETLERNVVDALTKMLDAGSCSNLHDIRLCGLNLNDVDCWQIVQSLKRSKVLQTLSLRDNNLLTKVTWKLLLENLSIRTLYLEGCKILLNDLNEQDADALTKVTSCCENVRISLNPDVSDIDQFEMIKRMWTSITQYAGKIFRNGQMVWLTTTPENITNDTWEYCHS